MHEKPSAQGCALALQRIVSDFAADRGTSHFGGDVGMLPRGAASPVMRETVVAIIR
jgi:hypothetical protein